MKILMTGSDGYIGSHLKPYLESKGHEVDGYLGEITEFSINNNEPLPDMVIHLAALTGVRKSIEMTDQYYEVNVVGTREVFMSCQEYDIPVLFASSSNAKEVNNPYAETKLSTKKIALKTQWDFDHIQYILEDQTCCSSR